MSKGGSDKRICQERQQISGAKRASSVHGMHKTPVIDALVATRELRFGPGWTTELRTTCLNRNGLSQNGQEGVIVWASVMKRVLVWDRPRKGPTALIVGRNQLKEMTLEDPVDFPRVGALREGLECLDWWTHESVREQGHSLQERAKIPPRSISEQIEVCPGMPLVGGVASGTWLEASHIDSQDAPPSPSWGRVFPSRNCWVGLKLSAKESSLFCSCQAKLVTRKQ